jgi:hypothetical protein
MPPTHLDTRRAYCTAWSGESFGVLETSTRLACDYPCEDRRRAPAVSARSAPSERACRSFSVGQSLCRSHSHWAPRHRRARRRYHFRSLATLDPPGIRARSLAQSLACAPVTPGQYVPSWIWRSARATWHCSISPLIANCVAAISIQSRWRLLRATAAPVGPATQVPAMQGREAQVRFFVEAYREQQGRDPRFTEVCNTLRLPPSTASDYLR